MSLKTIEGNETQRNMDANFDNLLKISFNPGKLSDLAAVSFAAFFLRYKIKHMSENRGEDLDDYSTDRLDPASFSVPKSLRDRIDDVIKDTDLSWVEWWSHHKKRVFLNQISADEMVHWIDDLVWLPDSTINYEKTARKMLDGDRTTNVQKFQLACAYCFMDDVERLTKTLTENEMETATKGELGHTKKFYAYWYGRLGVGNFLREIIYSLEMNDYVTSLKRFDEWPIIEYFFDRLNLEERTSTIYSIIHLKSPRLTLNILSKLTGYEVDLAIRRNGHTILYALTKNPFYFEQIMMIWKFLVPLIKDHKVGYIIRYVNEMKLEQNYLNSLIWEMWLVTSESQKKFIVDYIIYYTEFFLEKHDPYYIPNFPLIFDILQRSDPDKRHKFWSVHWPYLVIGQLDRRTDIERIIKLCFPNDQEIENFKKTVMIECVSIAKHCNSILLIGRIQEIQTYLEFCISDPRVIRDLKKKIISMVPKSDMVTFLFEGHTCRKLTIFYDHLADAFGEDEIGDFLEKIVLDDGSLKRLCSMCTSPRNLQRVIQFVGTFVSVGDNLSRVKFAFFEYSSQLVFTDESTRLDFMAWCLNVDKLLVNKYKTFASRKRRTCDDHESTDSKKRIYKRFCQRYKHKLRNAE